MKKRILLIITFLFITTLAACGKQGESENEHKETPTNSQLQVSDTTPTPEGTVSPADEELNVPEEPAGQEEPGQDPAGQEEPGQDPAGQEELRQDIPEQLRKVKEKMPVIPAEKLYLYASFSYDETGKAEAATYIYQADWQLVKKLAQTVTYETELQNQKGTIVLMHVPEQPAGVYDEDLGYETVCSRKVLYRLDTLSEVAGTDTYTELRRAEHSDDLFMAGILAEDDEEGMVIFTTLIDAEGHTLFMDIPYHFRNTERAEQFGEYLRILDDSSAGYRVIDLKKLKWFMEAQTFAEAYPACNADYVVVREGRYQEGMAAACTYQIYDAEGNLVCDSLEKKEDGCVYQAMYEDGWIRLMNTLGKVLAEVMIRDDSVG